MLDHILSYIELGMLAIIVLVDVGCWWEARQANHVMKLYFLERKKWYAARSKTKELKNDARSSETVLEMSSSQISDRLSS